jgi:hypothetical protein
MQREHGGAQVESGGGKNMLLFSSWFENNYTKLREGGNQVIPIQ